MASAVMLGGCVAPRAAVAPSSTETASFGPASAESCVAHLRARGQPLGSDEFVLLVQDQTDKVIRHERLLVVLDGTPVFQEDRPEALRQGHRVILRSRLVPGAHTLRLFSKLRGSGQGKFRYLRGYRFDVKSIHQFQIMVGRALCLTIHIYLRDASLPVEQRPALRYVEQYSPEAERKSQH